MPGALEGVLVADFSRVLAGPYATMLLGDLGALAVIAGATVPPRGRGGVAHAPASAGSGVASGGAGGRSASSSGSISTIS